MAPHIDVPSPAGSVATDLSKLSFSSASSLRFEGDGDSHITRLLAPGVYVPTICFFDHETEDIDTDSIARHVVRLAQAGVMGIATQGSNGEAVHLTHTERNLVTATTRSALDHAGFSHISVIVGCGAQSTRETIEFCCEAAEAGGDYALVLPPSYYATLFAPSSETIMRYFTEVADASPIPIIIYNFPGAVNGMDLSSDIILTLAQHPRIVGVKLTCGNTGKLNRIASAVRKTTKNSDGSDDSPEFLVLAGSADFTIQSLIAGGHGILAGLANIAPKACIKTVELCREGRIAEAQKMQAVVSRGDWTAIQGGVVGVKSGLQSWLGYGGLLVPEGLARGLGRLPRSHHIAHRKVTARATLVGLGKHRLGCFFSNLIESAKATPGLLKYGVDYNSVTICAVTISPTIYFRHFVPDHEPFFDKCTMDQSDRLAPKARPQLVGGGVLVSVDSRSQPALLATGYIQARERQISSWVGDDQRILGVVRILFVPLFPFLILVLQS
ncbi:aldolase [Xylariaceae sp. AK1471]|nr:aldolase [Xylariaceae sp. AK1471]